MLEIKVLCAAYTKIDVLRKISFTVGKGEIVCIIGSNGAGKTTTLNTIAGLVKKTGGDISFLGSKLSAKPHKIVSSGIVLVPEGRKIFTGLTVRENLMIGAYLNKDKKEIKRGMDEVFELFPVLKERSEQFGGTLSGGEQQMIAVGRGIMSRPKLLMLDEPSLGLAPKIVEIIFNIIKDIRDKGITVLLVEQNANKSLSIADYAYVLENGTIKHHGTGNEMKDDPVIARAYLGIKDAQQSTSEQ